MRTFAVTIDGDNAGRFGFDVLPLIASRSAGETARSRSRARASYDGDKLHLINVPGGVEG
jgi:hypothetical protein